MLQGWDKVCFTGGIVELSVRLPGRYDVSGLWPAVWMVGNLVRATYTKSSDNVWPWSFNKCTPDSRYAQRFSGCEGKRGRGAPEIDIIEGMGGNTALPRSPIHRPYFSTSLQVAPALKNVPQRDAPVDVSTWYNDGVSYGKNASVNIYFYGLDVAPDPHNHSKDYKTNTLSANVNLTKAHFEGFHTYRLEWMPPSPSLSPSPSSSSSSSTSTASYPTHPNGYLKWYLDNVLVFSVEGSALEPTGALIPVEPMYLILNMAVR